MEGPRYDPTRYRECRQPTQVPEAEAIEDCIARLIGIKQDLGVLSLKVRQELRAARNPPPWDGRERRRQPRQATDAKGKAARPESTQAA